MTHATLLVIAKAPAPGRSKTRLCPPCSRDEAARLAAAALADTIAAVAATPARRRVLVLDRTTGGTVDVPAGFEVLDQRGDGLDERLAAAFADARATDPDHPAGDAPALLVGMDTPQATAADLAAAWDALTTPGVDAVLGGAEDGGYWAIGLRAARDELFHGVPMSAGTTGREQRRRLEDAGLVVAALPTMRDVDRWDDAVAVAALAPGGAFAAAVATVAVGVSA